MRQIQRTCAVAVAACAALGVGSLATSANAAPTLLAQYSVANYDAVTGVWTDSVGGAHNATAVDTNAVPTNPTLALGATPNGASAVQFSGTQYFSIGNGGVATTLPIAVFAVVNNAATTFRHGIVGSVYAGSAGGFSYSLQATADQSYQQQVGRSSQPTTGRSPNFHPGNQFDVVSFDGGQATGKLYFDGAWDGDTAGTYFDTTGYPITVLGLVRDVPLRNDFFNGKIAEIRIYTGGMTDAERLDIVTELNTAYGTTVPEPAAVGVVAAGGLMLAARRRRAR